MAVRSEKNRERAEEDNIKNSLLTWAGCFLSGIENTPEGVLPIRHRYLLRGYSTDLATGESFTVAYI